MVETRGSFDVRLRRLAPARLEDWERLGPVELPTNRIDDLSSGGGDRGERLKRTQRVVVIVVVVMLMLRSSWVFSWGLTSPESTPEA